MMNLINIFFEHPILSSWFLLIIFIITYQIFSWININYEKRLELKTVELKNKKIFLDSVEKNFILDNENRDLSNEERKREWFYSMISEAKSLEADLVAHYLRTKKRPAFSKADEIAGPIKKEIRILKKENKRLQTELAIFDEYFPEFSEMREHVLDSEAIFSEESEDGDKTDRARMYLSSSEYEKLDVSDRNQKALDRYINKNHSQQEIGRFYERYLGYIWEKENWDVTFKGIVDGFEDLGRDLICKKNGKIEIIQAKNWSIKKTIHEKHIYQLFATKTHFCLSNNIPTKKRNNVKAIFACTTGLSDMALEVAEYLDIEIREIPLIKDYPMIKCNINPSTKSKIYHLPFDQQYDKIKVGDQKGEMYVSTVKEAEKLGFRRAFRWRPQN